MTDCPATTRAGQQCSRRGRWTVPTRLGRKYCKQHARAIATAPGGPCRLLAADGHVERVTALPRRYTRPLPSGRDAIVRELARASTPEQLARIRLAIAQQFPHLLDRGGLAREVTAALRTAETRALRRTA